MTATVTDSGHPPADNPTLHDERAAQAKRDEAFMRVLNAAGLACELHIGLLAQISGDLSEARIDTRRMDILEQYYAGGNDPDVATRRRKSDRFFVHRDTSPCSAHDIVATLAKLNPEVASVQIQRIGNDGGPLVLRAGEHFSVVTDPDDEQAAPGTVAVRALIRALNSLLARANVAERLISLLPDDERELYVGVTEVGAMTLMQAGCTEQSTVDALRDFASW
jgi:hypothetical protein